MVFYSQFTKFKINLRLNLSSLTFQGWRVGKMTLHVEKTSFAVWFSVAVFSMMVGLSGGADLMMKIDAGRQECFYEDMRANRTLYIDYSVVSTTQGSLDIDFQVSDIHARPIITEMRRTESHHE